jgi:hypothetical protein
MKELPALFWNDLVLGRLKEIIVGVVFMFSLVKKSVVNMVDDFKIGDGARVLA